jgi:hypothetical protein
MQESPYFLPAALAAVALLCLFALVRLAGLSGRVARLERALVPARDQPPERDFREEATAAASGAFETFLDEDPARRNLPKNEQFAAFRRWRVEKGLNWRASADSD